MKIPKGKYISKYNKRLFKQSPDNPNAIIIDLPKGYSHEIVLIDEITNIQFDKHGEPKKLIGKFERVTSDKV